MPTNPRRPALDAILAETRTRVVALQGKAAELERQARAAPMVRPFLRSKGQTVGVIAEVKRRSPSQGAIRVDLDPVRHARAYERGGAVGVSVLTEEAHFGGSVDDLTRVAAAVALPVLRKDFVLNGVQILEARAAGASAVLLIARVLTPAQLQDLARTARGWDLVPLIEVHAPSELEAALAAGPSVLGVNARDLDTFEIDLTGAEAIIRRVPPEIVVVAESGIEDREDVERLAAAGADFVLVGTSVARQDDPEKAVRALVGVMRQNRQ
jgi:indole-3-glycerol phosphate synthase